MRRHKYATAKGRRFTAMKKETFKLRFFPKAYFFNMEDKWLVIEKEWGGVCVYATSKKHKSVHAAVPMCVPKYLKGQPIEVKTTDSDPDLVLISAADLRVVIDYGKKICAFNKNTDAYGSDSWGQNCIIPWPKEFDAYFE